MKTIGEVIHDQLNGLMTIGIRRYKYQPYDMNVALLVVSRIGKGIDPRFDIEPVKEIYKELIRYFHGDDDFNGDLTKGIMIQGNTGTGKTLAMQIMRIYQQIDDVRFIFNNKIYRMNFELINVNDMINGFMVNGFDGIDAYCNRYVLCLDDIGTESEIVKYYGNDLDVVGHILSERYAKRMLTFATTNFTMMDIEEKYGDRISSRIYAMFNFIIMKGRDFRKPIKTN